MIKCQQTNTNETDKSKQLSEHNEISKENSSQLNDSIRGESYYLAPIQKQNILTPTHRIDLNFDSHEDNVRSISNGIQTFTKFSSTYFDESTMKKDICLDLSKINTPSTIHNIKKNVGKAEKEKFLENLTVNRSPKQFVVHKDHYNK